MISISFIGTIFFMLIANQLNQGSAKVLFFQPPILDIETPYLDINASGTLEINCIGKHPLFWKLPDRNEIVANDTRLSIHNSEDPSPTGRLFKTKLLLNDVGYTDTGYYSCYYDGTTDFEFRDNITSVYAFINDPVNLFIERSSIVKGHMLVILQHNRKAVIACLPTNSKANVTLWKTENEFDGGEMVSLGTDILFDPREGFVLFYPTIYFSGLFQCRTTLGNQKQHINLTLFYMPDSLLEPIPFIDASEAVHPIVHGNFTLKCIVNIDPTTRVYFHWSYPNKNNSRINDTTTHSMMKTTRDYMHREVISYLYVKDVQPSDSGLYKCSVTDHAEKSGSAEVKVFVYASRQPMHVNFTTDMDLSGPVVYQAGKDVQFVIFVHAYPSIMDVVLYWLKNGELYPSDPQFQLKTTGNTIKLELNNLTRQDAGDYTLVGKTLDTVNNISIILDVEDKPLVTVRNVVPFYMVGEDYQLECRAEGVPTPAVWWRWKPCDEIHNCQPGSSYGYKNVERNSRFPNADRVTSQIYGIRNHSVVAYLKIRAHTSGHYLCAASNLMGQAEGRIPLVVTDAKDGFELSTTDASPVAGDRVVLTCKANVFDYANVRWKWIPLDPNRKPSDMENATDITKLVQHSNYSHTSELVFDLIHLNDSGTYECQADRYQDNVTDTSNITLRIQDIRRPSINSTNMKGTTIFKSPGSYQEFHCDVDGVPEPRITWLKNGIVFDVTNMSGVEIVDDDEKLILKRVLEKDSGFYECVGENRGGRIKANSTLTVLSDMAYMGLTTSEIAVVVALVVFGLILVVLVIIFIRRVCQERKQRKELDFLSQGVFERGYVDIFNSNLPIQDQVELLPYKYQWEFPKERLKLGKTLGQGAFGRVVKAEAIGVVDGEASTTVAVKMLKETANKEHRKALIAELKILIYLGKHLNIVNLLGAVTKNLAKGELMVMVEYCCYGNLRHFLLKHKQSFVNQLDPMTGLLNPFLPSQTLVSNDEVAIRYANILGMGLDNPSYGPQFLNYANLSHSEANLSRTSERYFPEPQSAPSAEDAEDCVISTCSLLCFAFQCARGMEYLASKKLIHRDLAARNVLLAKDNVVKICDFGLAKDRHNYKYLNYVKKTDGLMPIKWMAIESVCDRVFTTKSDVWSFGILLWEMFTLGGNPYPGSEINDEFVRKLKNGYRMEKPGLAPDSIYDIMRNCWLEDPNLRADFSQLSETIGSLLEAGVRKYYVELNAPYQVMNTQLLNNNDYLQMGDGIQTEYTKMSNDDPLMLQNSYSNVAPLRPMSNEPLPKMPMDSVPMIQLESFSSIEKPAEPRSASMSDAPTEHSSAEEEPSKSDDDDSVFLDESLAGRQQQQQQQRYINGFMQAIQSSAMSTRC